MNSRALAHQVAHLVPLRGRALAWGGRCKGDGNCFYRAYGFALVESPGPRRGLAYRPALDGSFARRPCPTWQGGRESGEELGSSRTTGTTKVWGVRMRSGRGARRVMLGESFGGEVESGRRRRNSPLGEGEDRLIMPAVAGIAAAWPLDVGRHWHRAVPGERLTKSRSIELEP